MLKMNIRHQHEYEFSEKQPDENTTRLRNLVFDSRNDFNPDRYPTVLKFAKQIANKLKRFQVRLN